MLKNLLLGLTILVSAGCATGSTTPDLTNCQYSTPVISNAAGKLHGEACTSNAECKYGTCTKAALQLGGAAVTKGVCTKQCSCGGSASVCANENVTDASGNAVVEFKCIKAPTGAGSECARYCTSAADCKAWNPELPYCVAGVSGKFQSGVKVCSAVSN